MTDGRLHRHAPAHPSTHSTARRIAAAALAMVTTGVALAATSPAQARPDIEGVQAKVDRLYHQAEIASERYNTAKAQLASAQTSMKALRADQDRQQAQVDRMRRQVASTVVKQYQGDALSTASQVVLSDDPDRFLNNMSAISAYDSQRSEQVSSYRLQLERLHMRRAAVADETASLAKLRSRLAGEKKTIDDKAAQAKSELDRLKAAERARLARQRAAEAARQARAAAQSSPAPSSSSQQAAATPAPSAAAGSAKTAVDFAMAQVGKPYVYGASGPSAYDCSGLTMAAWGAAGVSLPHSASAQMSSGTPVSESQLQPGDLVFYYSPVSHVGMYIGGGKIVNAENPSAGIVVTGLHTMPMTGAVRPG